MSFGEIFQEMMRQFPAKLFFYCVIGGIILCIVIGLVASLSPNILSIINHKKGEMSMKITNYFQNRKLQKAKDLKIKEEALTSLRLKQSKCSHAFEVFKSEKTFYSCTGSYTQVTFTKFCPLCNLITKTTINI